MPGREEDVTMSAVACVAFIGVFGARTVPRSVGKTMDARNLKEGEKVVLVFLGHDSYRLQPISVMWGKIKGKASRRTQSLNKEGKCRLVFDEVEDLETVRSSSNGAGDDEGIFSRRSGHGS